MAKQKKAVKRRTNTKPARPQEKYETLHDLFILKLRSLHDIEQQILKALPKLAKFASNADLQRAFKEHEEETRTHVERLEEALNKLAAPVGKSRVEAIRGLVTDADWIMKSVKNPAARDVMLIAAAQYVEHYEIAGYGTAHAWAEQMGHTEVADLLEATLGEEGATNKKLTELAEGDINEAAASGMGDDEST